MVGIVILIVLILLFLLILNDIQPRIEIINSNYNLKILLWYTNWVEEDSRLTQKRNYIILLNKNK